MHHKSFYCGGSTHASLHAAHILSQSGLDVSRSPGWDIGHLLLDVPSFRPGSYLSQEQNLDTLLSSLPQDITIWGGNLDHPSLAGFHRVDLLKNESYLQENAAITARCALKLALPLLHTPPQDSPVLIIGWGRIGKYLAALLREKEYPVMVAVRQEETRRILTDLGYEAVDCNDFSSFLPDMHLIFNTAPAPVLSEEASALCKNCIKMDLASKKGIAGNDVIWARGLPGIHAPEESGALIARTILDLLKEEAQ